MGSIIYEKIKNGSREPLKEEGQHYPELMKAAEDLISAVNSKDANKVASAISDAFRCLEKHEEPNE